MKGSKKQMKSLEKISNADAKVQQTLKSVIRPVKADEMLEKAGEKLRKAHENHKIA